MILTRDRGYRMWVGDGTSGGGGGGVSSSQLAGMLIGYATETWVDEHYISIDFFSRLFQAHGTENGSEIDVMPNDMDTVITSVESMFGFWTNLYISALGSNGAAPAGISLGMLTDVTISGTPSAGQVLTFDAVSGKWVNGNAQAGATALANLTDVLLSQVQNGQTLLYDSSTSKWYNSALKTINGQSLLGSGDISVGGGASGNYLPLTGGTLLGKLILNFAASNSFGGMIELYNSDGNSWPQGIHVFWTNSKTVDHNTIILGGVSKSTNNAATFNFAYRGYNSASTYIGIGFYGNDNILNVTTQKRVGIGTSSPETSLDVSGSSTFRGSLYIKDVNTGSYNEGIRISNTLNDSFCTINLGCDPNSNVGTHQNQWQFGRSNDNTFFLKCYETTLSQIKKDGDFHISGGVYINATKSDYREGIRLSNRLASNTYSTIVFGADPNADSGTHSAQWQIGRNSDNQFFWNIGGNVIATIGTNGYLGLGTQSPSYPLHVAGTIYATGAITALSDARKKDIVGEAEVSVEQIAHAPAVQFLWKDKERRKDGQQVGTLAQYWWTVLPEVVSDKGGELSMQYGVAALVSAIVTARKVVDHERRIHELEKENERLSKELWKLKFLN